MSVKTIEILEQLKSLTPLEKTELVKQIEETFDVEASPRSLSWGPYIIDPPFIIDEDFDEFKVILEEVPIDKKIAILKVVRTLTDLGLKEAKDFVESTPQVVKYAIALHEAEEIQKQLQAVGAKVAIGKVR